MTPLAHAEPAPIAAPARTLRELAPRFLQWFALVRQRRPRTIEAYRQDLQTFLGFCAQAGLVDPDAVRFQHVEFYLGWLQAERGLKPQSANRHLHALRTFWVWLRREGFAAGNPAADTFLLPAQKKLPGYLTVPEQETVLTALARGRSALAGRDYALVATALLTGLRCSELANLQMAHVDLAAGRLRVLNGKGGKDRELPIIPRLGTILTGYYERTRPGLVRFAPSPWLFVRIHPKGTCATSLRQGQPLGARALFHLVKRAVAPLIGRPVHPHMLRHSFASRLRENGADLQLIQEALGHASIHTTTMYAHLTTSRRRQELARLLE